MADEEYTGKVVVRVANKGSKSEHRAVFLETAEGVTLRLKRPSGPPFVDPVLMRLEGHEIRCRGSVEKGQLVLSDWKKIEPD